MDSTVVSAVVIVIGAILAFFHISYAGDLTVLVNSVVILIAAGNVWYQRTTLMKAPAGMGDVKATGFARN